MFFSVDLRFLRALRLVRVFKLTRYSSSMTLLLKVLRDEAQSFGAAFFILIIVLIFASSGIYLFEHEVQPESFGNIPQAVWWSVSTLATVGYGDVIPFTVGGKIFGIVIMIIGIGIVALPAGILASAFSEQMRLRRVEYEELAQEILEDSSGPH
jgi:voltage-gated potassium channel